MTKTLESLQLSPDSLTEASQEKVRCLIRGESLAATAEEVVRQRLLRYMTEELGYPRHWLCVEKRLAELPHLALSPSHQLPKRRIDILCYALGPHPTHSLNPLILIECKAVPITARAVRQVIGYNLFIKAPYLCLVNATEMRFGQHDVQTQSYRFGDRFPSYAEIKGW